MSQNWYEIHIYLQWHTNRDLHTLYSRMSFRLTLSDLAKYSMTWRMARSLCYSWASCWNLYACIAVTFNWRGSLLMHDVYSNEQLFSVMCGVVSVCIDPRLCVLYSSLVAHLGRWNMNYSSCQRQMWTALPIWQAAGPTASNRELRRHRNCAMAAIHQPPRTQPPRS